MLSKLENNQIRLTALLLLLLPYLILSFFCNPIADDFTYSARGRENDLLATLHYEYFNWNGRYFSNLLVLLNPMAFNSISLYKLAPLIQIITTLLAFAIFVYAISFDRLKKIEISITALLLTLLFLCKMPIISEGIYWHTGAVTYQTGNNLFLIFISLLILEHRNKLLLKSALMHFVLSALILICAIGCNEITMLTCLSFLVIVNLIVFIKKIKVTKTLLLYFIIATLFSAVVYFAPGNDVREGFAENKHLFWYSLEYSFLQTIRFALTWLTSPALLSISLLYIISYNTIFQKIPLFRNSFDLNIFQALLFLFLCIFISIFPAYWSMGILGQHRTLNIAYFSFIILWFILLTVALNKYERSFNNAMVIFSKHLNKIIIVAFLFLMFEKNGYGALSDLCSGSAHRFNKQMNERTSILQSGDKIIGDTIYFTAIKDKPKTLFVLDIKEDWQHWSNKGYAIYFRVDKKIMKK